MKQGESVKKLKKIHYKDYGSPLINAKDEKKYWESIRQIPYVVFCESTYKSPEKLLNTLSNYYLDNNIGREGQFDIIVILNEYIVVNVGNGGIIYFEEFDQNGFYIMDSKEKTLLSFLFTLNLLPCFSSKDLTHPIITDYVPPMQFALKEDRLINHKLRELNNQVPDFEKRD
ncbi:MAG: hypothetical protein LIO65_04485 [Odoribacter sp.]|nr:hypothetical protein [Odoribacter sp.]